MSNCNNQGAYERLGLWLAMLTLVVAILAAADIGYSAWARVTVGQAVREGTRFAIAGPSFDDASIEDSVRQVVFQNSSGLLEEGNDSHVGIRYSTDESGITVVHVDARASRQTPLAALLGSAYPIDVTASCYDVVDRLGAPPASEAALDNHQQEQTGDDVGLMASLREPAGR